MQSVIERARKRQRTVKKCYSIENMLNLKLSRIHVKFGLTTIILNGKEVKYLIRAQNGLRGTMPIILCDQK